MAEHPSPIMKNIPGARNIRLVLSYDGTDFSGWQRQENRRTIQGAVEAALKTMHHHPVAAAGAGRTDAGVHAVGQVANFYTSIARISPERFVPALNRLLPHDIRIIGADEVADNFHARFSAYSRTYRYHIICGRSAFPHELRYALHLRRYPRLDILNDYARLLKGEMDCSIFAASIKDKKLSPFRYVDNSYFFVQGQTIIFEISANAFLHKMVRSIVGTFLFYEEKHSPVTALKQILASGNRALAGPTALPAGLFLWKVQYR
ncbi:MAG: tRNA pseudouridine(38-40) synthase TruA [Spirochaetaceae bacterium]|jgi:tRNA pseudouridine38-40 synthase|nr:tRNA pseudouridine(38-40) synthase TruA [Spirochaetaceae bacterium]